MEITKHLKAKFLTGLFILIPLIVTVYIIYLVVSSVDGIIHPIIGNLTWQLTGNAFYIPGTGFILFIVVTYITGVFASNYLGKKLLARGEALLRRIPFVKGIYGSVKDMTHAFTSDKVKSFKEVVLVEYPFKGRYAIGFVTDRTEVGEGKKVCSVFIPTTPNPTSGFLIIVKEDELTFLDMPNDDALKYIVSLGASRITLKWKEQKSLVF
jgi:uncharacterized membrane protein